MTISKEYETIFEQLTKSRTTLIVGSRDDINKELKVLRRLLNYLSDDS